MPAALTHAVDGQPASPAALAVLRLTERWAEAARAQSIYPVGHHRIATALSAWREALDAARAAAGAAALQAVFTGQGLVAQEAALDVSGDGNLTWLRERLDHAALAGVVVGPDAAEASLEAFNRRLLSLYAQKDAVADVAVAWSSGDWPGLRPLDRRFEGVFDGEPTHVRETQRTWEGGGRGAGGGERDRLVESLMTDRALAGRVRALSARLASSKLGAASSQAKGDEAEQGARDILAGLTRMLPSLATQDEAHARTIVGHLVEAVEERQGNKISGTELAALLKAPELERRAAWLCTTLLREDVAPESATRVRTEAPRGPQGHAGDERIRDDLDGFLTDLAHLPAFEPGDAARLEAPAETLGVLLHLLLHHEDPSRIAGLLGGLKQLLTDVDEERLAALRRVLSAASQRADAALASQGIARITQALRELKRLELLRACGFLSLERVIEGFPGSFGDWLATLRPEAPDDQRELQEVLGQLGSQRVLAHAGELMEGGGLGTPGMAPRLLASGLRALAPLARVWVTRGGTEARAAVAGWLRAQRLKDREAQVLEMVEDAGQLPEAVLLGLVDLVEGRPWPVAATPLVVEAIANFVRAAAGREDRRARRLAALRELGRYDHPVALAVLRAVVNSRRWIVVPVEDRIVRQVAVDTLRSRGAA